ncbi:ABC transporter ATP-binding protein [Actinoplanes couchii]|uniref:ABC transporter ATP-binding protein n=1 Tax=Actinoplanes couchii TaxID=403638 RepID=UPI0019444E38|nr:ABC transporter ATP-binding protein [Actinoplanes couchii]MDR6316366.1 sulfonate transport system ATP-binding protein [Actinoplanes couchii]
MSAVPLQISGVGREFAARGRRHAVLSGIDLDVAAGEVVALLGPSGCGKSTLLRIAGGLDRPTSGSVRVDGREVRGIEPRCAVVFQEPRLLPWRTLERNVAYGLPRDVTGEAARAEVAHWLSVVGLGDFAGHRPRQVSGGMAQRAALARALARRPGVLLLDEPFAALDALTRLRMQDLLAEVQREAGTTVLLVTHDVDEALHLADRVVLLGHTRPDEKAATPDEKAATSVERTATPGETTGASSVRLVLDVPGGRPRDRGDATLAALRSSLLAELGVRTAATAVS